MALVSRKKMRRRFKGNVVISEVKDRIKTDSFNTKYFVGKINAMFCNVLRMTS